MFINFFRKQESIFGGTNKFMFLISLFADFNRISLFQVWGCGLPKQVDEQAIEEYQRELRTAEQGAQQRANGPSATTRKSSSSSHDEEAGAGDAKKPKPKRENRNDNWDVDKQLLEMAGFEFDRHRRAAPPPPPED